MRERDDDIDALKQAIEALEKALAGLEAGTSEGYADFAFGVGFARGKLSRVSERIYGRPE